MRRGMTLAELMIGLCIVGVLTGVTLPRFGALTEHAAVRGATTQVLAALSTARSAALARSRNVAVRFDSAAGSITVYASADTIVRRALRSELAVELSSTRDSIAYAPTGLGWGASNTTIVVSRGGYADTITVSRLGRARSSR